MKESKIKELEERIDVLERKTNFLKFLCLFLVVLLIIVFLPDIINWVNSLSDYDKGLLNGLMLGVFSILMCMYVIWIILIRS